MRVAIVGLGLIGGSLALALRRHHPAPLHLTGVDGPEVLARAARDGVVDRTATDPREAAADAELVVLAAPLGANLEILSRIGPAIRPGTLVTDVGSTKRAILEAAASLPAGAGFIGGHPMAGKESSSLAHADADLFQGASWVLVPREGTAPRDVERLSGMVRSIGARPVLMTAEEHDRAAAAVSHLPQIVALCLCGQVASDPKAIEMAGPAFRGVARLARSPYVLWQEILASNRDMIRESLRELEQRLAELESDVGTERLRGHFDTARRVGDRVG